MKGYTATESDYILLTPEEVQNMVHRTQGWSLEDKEITREFQFVNFRQAIEFVNKVAEEAEAMDHHPDICILYNKVKLSLSTHKIGGLARQDFDLAERINSVAEWLERGGK